MKPGNLALFNDPELSYTEPLPNRGSWARTGKAETRRKKWSKVRILLDILTLIASGDALWHV
jgi:hypothetical protein